MSSEKNISLRKAVSRGVFIITISAALLLMLLYMYLFRNHRDFLQEKWEDSLNRYAAEIRSDLDEVNSELYEIYYHDSDFQTLSYAEGIDALPSAYALEDRLKTRLLVRKRGIGYVLYFDGLKNRRYYFGQDYFPGDEMEELKQLAFDLSSGSGILHVWYYRVVGGKAYALGIYRNKGVSLCEIYNLEDVREDLEDEVSEVNGTVFLEHKGEVLGDTEAMQKWGGRLNYDETVSSGVWLCRKQIKGTDLFLHLAVPIHVWTYINVQQVMVMLLVLLTVTVSLLFYHRFNKELFRPLDHLVEEMRRIGGGDWSRGIHTRSRFEEIQQVIGTTDRMIEEIEAQKLLTYEKTIQEQKARMQYLSLQLNPHFYLNGLKTLNYLALKGDTDRIQEIIIRLSGHLRYLLQREDEMVLLRQELEFTNSYIDLYREMTDRKITVDQRVDETARECLVPRLCIQTFVENSFKYARVGNTEIPLSLVIRTGSFRIGEEEYLEILVRDNGEGYSEQLLEVLNEPPAEGGLSVGINNLKRRCGFLYDMDVQYAFYNDGGAVNDIFYPWITDAVKTVPKEGEKAESVNCG